MSGKLKMVLQCVAVGVALFYLSYLPDAAPVAIEWLVDRQRWAAVVLTVYSGVAYVRTAITLLER